MAKDLFHWLLTLFVFLESSQWPAGRNWPNPRVLVRFVLPPQLQRSCYHAFLAAWQAWKLKRSFFFLNKNFCASNIINFFSFFFLFPLGAIGAIKGSTSIVMSPVHRFHNNLLFFGYFYHVSSLLFDRWSSRLLEFSWHFASELSLHLCLSGCWSELCCSSCSAPPATDPMINISQHSKLSSNFLSKCVSWDETIWRRWRFISKIQANKQNQMDILLAMQIAFAIKYSF